MGNDWPQPTNPQERMRHLERRVTIQERRAAATTAADLVGPGIAARAIEVYDWNDETTTYNGFFYSAPGARNSPELSKHWDGMVVARDDGSGAQEVWTVDTAAERLNYTRTFKRHPQDDTVILWGTWKAFATHTGMIGEEDLDPPVVMDIQTALDDAAAAMNFVESAIRVFRQAAAPAPGVGDNPAVFKEGWIWFDTDDNMHMRVWSEASNSWEEPDTGLTAAQEQAIIDAEANAAAALAAANDAVNFAQAKSKVYRQTDMPSEGNSGDIWFDTDASNRMFVHNGSVWTDPALTLISATIRSPNNAGSGVSPNVAPGIALGPAGLALYDSDGASVFLDAATGSATFKGSIAAGTDISGATITGGTVQTEATVARGIKMNSSGLIGYDSVGTPVFSLDTVGNLAVKGTIQSGSTIAGAVLSGVVETSLVANTGVKIANTGIFAYDGSNNVSFSLLSATGALSMTGPVVAGGDISGATVTGGTVQSEATPQRGVKMNSLGLVGYNGSGSVTFVLDAVNGALTVAGAIVSGSNITGGVITGTTFQTATSGTRVHISDESGVGYVRFPYGGGETLTQSGGIGAIAGDGNPRIQIASGIYPTRNGTATLSLVPQNAAQGNCVISANTSVSGTFSVTSTTNLQSTVTIGSTCTMQGSATVAGTLSVTNSFTANAAAVFNAGAVRMPALGSAGGDRSVRWDNSTGQLSQEPHYSMLAWKKDIEDLDRYGEAALTVRSIEFAYNESAPEYDRLLNPEERFKGMALDELIEAGLEPWIIRGPDGSPEGIDKDHWHMAQQAALRYLHEEIKSLRAQLTDGQ